MGTACYLHLGLLTSVLFSTATFAGGDYLVRVGPKPLRFAKAIVPLHAEKVLPPLIMTDEAPTKEPAPLEEFGPQPLAQGASEPEWIGPEPPDTMVIDPATSTTKPVSQESLLQFFNPSKRGGTMITTPVEFTPPPPSSRSSTATFISQ